MAHIMISMWWPSNPTKNAEIAKKAYEVNKKIPPDESIGITLAQGFIGDKMGTKSITIYNVKEGKLVEALTLVNDVLRLYQEIEGVTAKIDLMTTVEEAWARVGMKSPE